MSVEQKLKPVNELVMQDFLDVVPKDLPGLPFEREIDLLLI